MVTNSTDKTLNVSEKQDFDILCDGQMWQNAIVRASWGHTYFNMGWNSTECYGMLLYYRGKCRELGRPTEVGLLSWLLPTRLCFPPTAKTCSWEVALHSTKSEEGKSHDRVMLNAMWREMIFITLDLAQKNLLLCFICLHHSASRCPWTCVKTWRLY